MADTLRSLTLEPHLKTGLRDERHVIFDGGRRLMWCITFEKEF